MVSRDHLLCGDSLQDQEAFLTQMFWTAKGTGGCIADAILNSSREEKVGFRSGIGAFPPELIKVLTDSMDAPAGQYGYGIS